MKDPDDKTKNLEDTPYYMLHIEDLTPESSTTSQKSTSMHDKQEVTTDNIQHKLPNSELNNLSEDIQICAKKGITNVENTRSSWKTAYHKRYKKLKQNSVY
jgi:hypothetical protein